MKLSTIALLIILILLILYFCPLNYKDNFTVDQANSLLAYHLSTDPGSYSEMKKIYKEKLENKNENPALTALLYR